MESATGAPSPPDWTDQVVDLIIKTVDNLKRYTSEPVKVVLPAVIYGTLALGFVIPALVLVAIGGFHLFVTIANQALPGPDDNAWIAWVVLGVVLVAAGWFLFARRNKPAPLKH